MASRSDVSNLIGRKPLWRRWRVVTSVVLVGVIVGTGYWGLYRDRQTAAVVTTQQAKVTLGSLSTTLTASGTAAAEQSTPLTFTAGGLVTDVLVRLGEEVRTGQPLVRLDARTAQRNVETAGAALVQAQLRLQQLLEPSAVDRTAMQQSLVSARTQLESAQATSASLGKPTATQLLSAQNALSSARVSLQSSENSMNSTRASLYQAQNVYCSLALEATLGICDPEDIPINANFIEMLQTSISRGRTVPTQNLTSAVTSLISANASHTNALASRETAAASVLSAELSLKELTTPSDEAIRNARAAVETAQASYDSVLARAEALARPAPLDLAVQQQAVRSAEIALQQAQDALDDMTLFAPFGGKAGAVTAVVGQRIGAGTAVVVLTNPDAIRLDLTISEADLVNIKAGMLGLARFDSMPRNAYVVRVIGVSAVPTVTQGVVTYPVQAAILRGNALNDIRDQLPSLVRSLTSGASGAQIGAILGGGAGGAGGQRPQGAGAGGGQGQRPPGAGAGA
ncbi:MAG: HlyD family efflux transporter periplasmic adaptor subunit, partial [Chloroflexi bacterium]|nr:HlyD family efflux transporter periplasmic adaptor subunit [Chloroflexota bacterium]